MDKLELRAYYLTQGLSDEDADGYVTETAAHEAGHFVMAAMVGQCPYYVNILPVGEQSGLCGGVPFYTAYELSGDQLQQLMLSAPYGRRLVERGVCANIMHALAGGYATYWVNDDYDFLGVGADRESAQELAAKVFDDPQTVIDAMDSLCARAMAYKRVGAAIQDVAQWLADRVQPSDDEIERMYFDTARRIGFMRKRISAWIDGELDRRDSVSVRQLVDSTAWA